MLSPILPYIRRKVKIQRIYCLYANRTVCKINTNQRKKGTKEKKKCIKVSITFSGVRTPSVKFGSGKQ